MPNFDSLFKIFACISLIIGAVECFAGFKAMKVMLSIWGFFVGALIGAVGGVLAGSTILGAILAIVFAVTLAILVYKLYLAGVFLHTMFLTTVSIWLLFNNIWIALLLGVVLGIVAVFFVKPVVILSTSFSGSGILVSSAYLMLGIITVSGDRPVGFYTWIAIVLWVFIAVAGIFCQFITTQHIKSAISTGINNRGYNPQHNNQGMQRAYRNFCINCGRQLLEQTNKCPRCGFEYED